MLGHGSAPRSKRTCPSPAHSAPRVAAAAVVVLALGTAGWAQPNMDWGAQLAAELAALKAQGVPLTLAEAAPKPVPDDQNAAILYQQVFNAPDLGAAGLWDGEIDVLEMFRHDMGMAIESEEILSRPEVRTALGIFWQASQMPYCVFPINWQDLGAPFPHMARFRRAPRLIAAYCFTLATEGRPKEALDWTLVALRMSRHAAAEPTIIAQLISYEMQGVALDSVRQILADSVIDAARADAVEQELLNIDHHYEALNAALRTELAWGCDVYEAGRRDPKAIRQILVGTAGTDEVPVDDLLAVPPDERDQLVYVSYVRAVQEKAKLPYRDGAGQLDALQDDFDRRREPQMLAGWLVPAAGRLLQKRDWAVAEIGLCRVVLALKAYKHTRNSYPATLGQLQDSPEWSLPKDPFSGEDFVYQPQGEGFKLYSLGGDLDDDGGVPPDEANPGDGDIVWECIR